MTPDLIITAARQIAKAGGENPDDGWVIAAIIANALACELSDGFHRQAATKPADLKLDIPPANDPTALHGEGV